MTGYLKKAFKNIFVLDTFSERGAALVEFAIILPMLATLAYSGFNLMRMMEVNMLKKDFSRSLTLSYSCSFKQGDAARICYDKSMREILDYEGAKRVLENVDPNIRFYYSVHTYVLTDPVAGRSFVNCGALPGLEVTYVGGYKSDPYPEAHYDRESVQNRAGEENPILLSHLFDTPSNIAGQKAACMNGLITVAEVRFDLKEFFKFGSISAKEFYEISYI